MAEEPVVAAVPRCPWCSAPLPAATLASCPACGATLTGDGEAQLPGVTTLDTDAILRARSAAARPRSRLLSFITGEVDDGGLTKASAESIAPPSTAVLREMRRIALAAEVANLEAEVQAMTTEAEVEAREAGLVPSDEAIVVPSLSDVLGQVPGESPDPAPADDAPADVAPAEVATASAAATGPEPVVATAGSDEGAPKA
jgi:hypothetical protein